MIGRSQIYRRSRHQNKMNRFVSLFRCTKLLRASTFCRELAGPRETREVSWQHNWRLYARNHTSPFSLYCIAIHASFALMINSHDLRGTCSSWKPCDKAMYTVHDQTRSFIAILWCIACFASYTSFEESRLPVYFRTGWLVGLVSVKTS
jgi:hypothetical protein